MQCYNTTPDSVKTALSEIYDKPDNVRHDLLERSGLWHHVADKSYPLRFRPLQDHPSGSTRTTRKDHCTAALSTMNGPLQVDLSMDQCEVLLETWVFSLM